MRVPPQSCIHCTKGFAQRGLSFQRAEELAQGGIVAAANLALAEQGRLRQTGPGEVLDQPAAGVAVRQHGPERHPDPLAGLLPEGDSGQRVEGRVNVEFVESHNPTSG